jgi:hypothetical protein
VSTQLRLSLVLFGAVALAGASTAADARAPGAPPYRLGRLWFCPTGHDYVAYRRYRRLRRVYYPPFHPGRPSYRVRPTRCFRTTRQAERAGYHAAPLPRGTEEVGGIYLVPPERALRTFCGSAAQYAHLTVACPGLVPEYPYAVSSCELDLCAGNGYLYLEAIVSAPDWYVGTEPGVMHLWFVSFRAGRFADEPCGDGVLERTVEIRGQPGQLISCPPGQATHSDHVVARWQENGVVYEVSLHNHTDVNRDLVIEMAQRVRLVPPS